METQTPLMEAQMTQGVSTNRSHGKSHGRHGSANDTGRLNK